MCVAVWMHHSTGWYLNSVARIQGRVQLVRLLIIDYYNQGHILLSISVWLVLLLHLITSQVKSLRYLISISSNECLKCLKWAAALKQRSLTGRMSSLPHSKQARQISSLPLKPVGNSVKLRAELDASHKPMFCPQYAIYLFSLSRSDKSWPHRSHHALRSPRKLWGFSCVSVTTDPVAVALASLS